MSLRKIALWLCIAAVCMAVLLYAVLLVVVWAAQERILFGRRTHDIVERPSDRGWEYEEVLIAVKGETTHGWWIPLDDATGAILFSHGSGRNISGYLNDAALFRDLGYSVLLYDYGGYGLSTGKPSERRCYADVQAMWNFLLNDRGIGADGIILAGSSLGGGVTTHLAAQVSPRAVILESTFISVPDAVRQQYPFLPPCCLNRIRFPNIENIARISCPILVVHSNDDRVVPFSHGRALYQRIETPKAFLEISGAHYGGKFTSGEAYLSGLGEFLSSF